MAGLQRLRKGVLERVMGRLRFPYLFLATAVLFLIDVAVPDALPFADEIFLVLLTTLLGSFKDRRRPPDGEAEDAATEDPRGG